MQGGDGKRLVIEILAVQKIINNNKVGLLFIEIFHAAGHRVGPGQQ